MTPEETGPSVARLSVDETESPLAVTRERPHFSWAFRASERDVRQESYRITVARRIPGGVDPLWDSGVVESDRQLAVRYDGPGLPPAAAFTVRLVATLTGGGQVESSTTFETGPDESAWAQAAWITVARAHALHEDRRPTPVLRRRVAVRPGLVRARWYATAGGIYRPWLGGSPLSESTFAPGWTDYAHRVPFHAYDVTDRLARGAGSTIGADLADGWYSGFIGPFWKRGVWGTVPVLRALLLLEYADGSTEWMPTDGTWEGAFGAIQASDMLHGEVYDRRAELGGWSSGETRDARRWTPAQVAEGPAGELVPAILAPVRPVTEFAPVAVTTPEPGSSILDFGQNLAGRVRVRVDGPAGTIVRIRHAEILDSDGRLYVDNLRSARAADSIVLDGMGAFDYEPSFTYHGFRYAEITAPEGCADLESARAVALSSVPAIAGEFSTGVPLIDRLQHNIRWSMLSNTFEVPTDCPQRDERLGWAGDAQVFAATAMFNGALAPFYRKWLVDMADAQTADGAFADIAPGRVLDFAERGAAGYADAGVFVPWDSYLAYGDPGVLEDTIDGMLAWLGYIERANPGLLWAEQRNSDYGDWLAGEETDKVLVATAHFARAAQISARVAAVLGRDADARACTDLHARIAAAYRTEFGSRTEASVRTQAAAVFELEFELVEPGERDATLAELVRRVESAGCVLVGFLAVRYLLPLLCRAGRPDLAVDLLLREEEPSWGAQLARGLTTIGEHWSAWGPDGELLDPWMNSFNHVPLGAVGEWMYRELGGLAPTVPGYRAVRIAPIWNDPRIAGATTTHESPYGPVVVDWRRHSDHWTLDLDLPPGTSGEVHFPAGRVLESGKPIDASAVATVGSGSRSFTIHRRPATTHPTEETL